jgi:hypothetical protein
MRTYNFFTGASTSGAVRISIKTDGLDFKYTSDDPKQQKMRGRTHKPDDSEKSIRRCTHEPITFKCKLFNNEDIVAVREFYEKLDDEEARRKWTSKTLTLSLPGSEKKSAYYLPKQNKMMRVCASFFQLVLYLRKAELY